MKVTISKIVERNGALNEKVALVNEYLSKICKTTNNQKSQYQTKLLLKSK